MHSPLCYTPATKTPEKGFGGKTMKHLNLKQTAIMAWRTRRFNNAAVCACLLPSYHGMPAGGSRES